MREIQKSESLELILFCGASALLDKYGEVSKLVERDGFEIQERIYQIVEGENLVTMAKSAALGMLELPRLFDKYAPNFVIVVGDRFEMLSVAVTAVYMNIPIVHTMGGEFSGTVDEILRHAITKLSHIHFPANELAKQCILQMGEDEQYVFNYGCPRMDSIKEIIETPMDNEKIAEFIKKTGVGAPFVIDDGFLLVSQHPVTTEFGDGESQMEKTLLAVSEVSKKHDLPVIALWPNADAGSDHMSRAIRKFREKRLDTNFRFFKNLPLDIYVWLMNKTSCLIGNSSSGIREGAFMGTPVVNIGSRQSDRARGKNVIDVAYDIAEITNAINHQIDHGKYASDPVYGQGATGKRIIEVLETIDVKIQKKFITRSLNE
jgi:UDP-hydrolysing UDP-N-acetyl-D-glucosamine 2-epimerase